jgi:hypothetical protein
VAHLIEDDGFSLPGAPDCMDFAIAFGVFTHLPPDTLAPALARIRARLPGLQKLLLTVFLGDAPSQRQPDGVVTHAARPPYHRSAVAVEADAQAAGFVPHWPAQILPRGQRLCVLVPA